jgi:hypothetical protein
MQTSSLSRFGRRILMAVLFVVASVSGVVAQTNTTALSGTVTDPAGLKLPGAVLSLQNTATGEITSSESKSAGEYEFPTLIPGHYKLTVEHAGFSQQQIELDLLIATPQALNFKLTVGSVDTVVVEAPMIGTTLNQTDATLGKAFDNTQIQELPYLANNTLSLLALQPGVIAFDGNNTTDTRAGTIDGARQDQTNLTLDGTDNNDANNGYAFTGVLRATRDSIEEFRVTTAGANADAGRSSGAQVSLQTKSGTNHYHGSAYYYYRDPAMASNNWFNKQTQLGNTVNGVLTPLPDISAKVLQDTYGATLGMPIIKDKLFFFGAYEGYKQASDSTVTATVPLGTGTSYGTASGLRNGTLSYLDNGTTGTYTTLTPAQIAQMDPNCFAAGGCPAGPGVNAAVIAFLNKSYPTSNTVGGDTINTGGFSFVSPAPISLITNIARIDYIINSKQVLFVRGNLQSDNQAGTFPLPGGTPSTNTYGNNRGLTAGHIWTLSHNMTNNFRYGWTRQGSASRGAGGNYVSFAAISLPFSTSASTVLLQNTQDFVDDFSIVKGKHTIQFGGNDRLIYNHRFLTKYLYESASITANDVAAGGVLGQNTSLDVNEYYTALGVPKAATSFRSSYNSAVTAVTGLISTASAYANYSVGNNSLTPLPTGVVPPHEFRSFEQEYYLQDQWKVMPKLTITAGLRIEHLGVPFEVNGQQVRPQTSMTAFLANRLAAMTTGTNYNVPIYTIPGGPKNNAPGFWKGDKADLAPRFAFNYAVDSKTSIRGGFMMAYDHFGQGAVDTFNDSYSFGLSSPLGKGVQGSVDTDPRFTTVTAVPQSLLNAAPAGGSFPILQSLGSGGITQTFDDSLKTPYAETFNLTVQRTITKGLTFTATYTGRLGRHQLELRDMFMPLNLKDNVSGTDYYHAMAALDQAYDANVATANVPNNPYWTNLFPNLVCKGATGPTQAVYSLLARSNETATLYDIDVPGGLPSTCTDNGVTLNRYFASQYGSLDTQSSIGVSNYNAGQFSVRHTVNRNIVYDVNYTLAHSLDMGSSPERSQSNYITNTWNPAQMYANSTYDARHSVTADWIATLPYGHGQRFGANAGKFMDELLGGWQLTGVLKFSSAFPWTSSYGTSGWGTNWEISSSSIEIGKVPTPGHHAYYPGAKIGITGSAFGTGLGTNISATSSAEGANFRAAYVGESGQRDNLRADGYFSMDPGLSKSFHTFENQSFKLIVEYFNVTNATRFGSPGSGSTGTTFGQYLSSSGLLNSPRQAQVAGRYYF